MRFVQIDPSPDQAEKVHVSYQVGQDSRLDLGEVGRNDYPPLGCLQASLCRGAFDFVPRNAVKIYSTGSRESFRMSRPAIK